MLFRSVTTAHDPVYQIVEGVRRSVAAREVGLSTIAAAIQAADGKLGPEFDVSLEALYSSKASVPRLDSSQRYLRIERAMADPLQRVKVPAIVVSVLPSRLTNLFTPSTDVVLEV